MLDDLQRHIGKFYGKYSGEVADNNDTDYFGRIKVTVPSVFGTEVVVTARPCFSYGHFFVPPNGAHIWIEFEAGDPRYPLWVGVWYPQGKTPTEAAISPPDNRVIQTASGHTIQIMDKEGEEKITIQHKSKAFIAIDKDGSVLIGAKNGSSVVLNAADGNVMVVESHGNTFSMQDDSIVLQNKDGKATVGLQGGVVQVSSEKIMLRGSQVVLGEGAMEPVVLGTMFTTLFNAHTHPTALGPSGPPVPPLIPAVGPHLSKAAVAK